MPPEAVQKKLRADVEYVRQLCAMPMLEASISPLGMGSFLVMPIHQPSPPTASQRDRARDEWAGLHLWLVAEGWQVTAVQPHILRVRGNE